MVLGKVWLLILTSDRSVDKEVDSLFYEGEATETSGKLALSRMCRPCSFPHWYAGPGVIVVTGE